MGAAGGTPYREVSARDAHGYRGEHARAGHRIGANAIYAAKPDGLTMGLVDRYIPSFQLRGEGPEEGVRYDASKIGWLGSTTTETQVVFVNARTGVKEPRDLQNIDIRFTNATPGQPTARKSGRAQGGAGLEDPFDLWLRRYGRAVAGHGSRGG